MTVRILVCTLTLISQRKTFFSRSKLTTGFGLISNRVLIYFSFPLIAYLFDSFRFPFHNP